MTNINNAIDKTVGGVLKLMVLEEIVKVKVKEKFVKSLRKDEGK